MASTPQVVAHSPDGLPQTIVTPLLVPQFIDMMNKEASEEEFKLWQFLGDAWNVPRSESLLLAHCLLCTPFTFSHIIIHNVYVLMYNKYHSYIVRH